MSKKYVIDLPDDAQYILINGASENHCYTRVEQVDDLEELNSDYINEHYGELQDEAYKRGYEDGKKSQNDDRIEVGDEVEWAESRCAVIFINRDIETSKIKDYDLLADDGSVAENVSSDRFRKTGKHYDIQSILEAMRT